MKAKKMMASLLALALLICSCEPLAETENGVDVAYIPVMFEENGPISIIDSKGNIVVKDEYGNDNTVSPILNGNDKVYWVGVDNKKQLYSINNPKKPVTSEEYDVVTKFQKNRAVVTRSGNPIEIIDTKGKVVAILPDDIISVSGFSPAGTAVIKDSEGKKGWINSDGKIVDMGYHSVDVLDNGIVMVQKKEDGAVELFSADGKKTGSLAKKLEFVDSDPYNPRILVHQKDETGQPTKWQVVDNTGKEIFSIKRIDRCISFCNGYICFEYKDRCGVINDKGEEIIRPKYYLIDCNNNKKGLFTAKKSDEGKVGIINDKDEEIMPFEYSMISPAGDNFIVVKVEEVSENKFLESFNLVDKDGKELLRNDFYVTPDDGTVELVMYIDLEDLATAVVSRINQTDLTQNARTIASKLMLDNPEDNRASQSLTDIDNPVMNLNTRTIYAFDNTVVKALSHEEQTGDELNSETKTVVDGYEWNELAKLESVTVIIGLMGYGNSNEAIFSAIQNKLERAGYTKSDGVFTKYNKSVLLKVGGDDHYKSVYLDIGRGK